MALKDLVAQKARLTEEAIEDIVSDYVRYDIEEREILFTPEARKLSNKSKILVFLVAFQGWPFVLEEAFEDELTPARIEELTGIRGPTLRPTLKDLKDRHLIMAKSGRYSVGTASLDTLRAELSGGGDQRPHKKRRKSKKRPEGEESAPAGGPGPKRHKSKKSEVLGKGTTNTGMSLAQAFNELISSGLFEEWRTAADLREALLERAIIAKRTSLPGYLLEAVRGKRLMRKKQKVGGKSVWAYKTGG